MTSYSQLEDQMIISCAERLGAVRIPVEEIKRAYSYVMTGPRWGCLNTDDGRKLFIAYRLRDFGCFDVGCQSDEKIGTGCILHFFDMFYDTRNLTDEEYVKFMLGRAKEEPDVAATKFWKLIDSLPVDAVASRVARFYRKEE